LQQLGGEARRIVTAARGGKIEGMGHGVFTISNLGMFGIEEFTAIINPPNACILAIGSIRDVPVVKNEEIVPGKRMKLTLSCDHRIVDGATGARFLSTIRQMLEEPMNLLL
jgi:pyruvate dehydrogenase E2 component (dihydrolipoamide acetyltransferase)